MQYKNFRRWAIFGGIFMVALSAISSIILLRQWSEKTTQNISDLTKLQYLSATLEEFEWKAIATRKLDSRSQKMAMQSRQQADKIIEKLLLQKDFQNHLKEVNDAYQEYIRAFDEEFVLLAQGKIVQAKTLDEQRTDLAYEKLNQVLIQKSEWSEGLAKTTNQQADIGAIGTIIAAAILISLIIQKMILANKLAELATSEQALLKQNEDLLKNERKLLEIKIEERTLDLEEKNRSLANTLEKLKNIQNGLIQSEKMSTLGHLVAGIAHEINTPLGAIQASTGNISKALQIVLEQLPSFFQKITPEQQAQFFKLLEQSLNSKPLVSSIEKRPLKKNLAQKLQSLGFENSKRLADHLVETGISDNIEPFIELLKTPEQDSVLQLAYNLSRLQGNNYTIQSAAERATKIVSALKNYARFDQSDEKKSIQLTDGIETVLELYHNQLKRGVEVVRHYQPLPKIWCNPDELIQVWTNLIHNAVQAMEEKGVLEISTTSLGTQVLVQFIDSGSGIPADIQSKIFNPFFTTKPQGEGNGLGLGISQTIIQKHDGCIEVESRPGKTIFSVKLPIGETTQTMINPPSQVSSFKLAQGGA